MTPREIEPIGIHVGDRIRYERLGLLVVSVATADADLLHYTVSLDGVHHPLDMDGAKLTLLDRPLPPIPTDEGTVIRGKTALTWKLWVRRGDLWWSPDGKSHYVGDVTRDKFDVLVPEALS